jgi:hypothetical protein
MSTEPTKDDDITVVEEKDGSVTVEMPEALAPEGEETPQDASQGDEDQPGDTDAIREARRNRRKAKKEYIKRTNEEKDQRLQMLQRQNEDLMRRLSQIERKTVESDMHRLDKMIEDEELKHRYWDTKRKEAFTSRDAEAFARAEEALNEAKGRLYQMRVAKQKAADAPAEPQVDTRVVRRAKDWMERNDWYDPEGRDEDSQIAKIIDKKLTDEGMDPASEDYWEEFDTRLQKRLPHLYTQRQERSERRPRTVVTGSERESFGSGGTVNFRLEPEQVRAMKDAGFWDDKVKRAKMIKRYAESARNNRS